MPWQGLSVKAPDTAVAESARTAPDPRRNSAPPANPPSRRDGHGQGPARALDSSGGPRARRPLRRRQLRGDSRDSARGGAVRLRAWRVHRRRARPSRGSSRRRIAGRSSSTKSALLSAALQAKLLKVLEEASVRRLGSTRDEPIDVWISAATNEDLAAAIHARRFREDLYHRLAVADARAAAPARARRRRPAARRAFPRPGMRRLRRVAESLLDEARRGARAYAWPGNVRELANVIERVALLVVRAGRDGRRPRTAGRTPRPNRPRRLRPDRRAPSTTAVRDRVVEVLRHQTSWNISRTAALARNLTQYTARPHRKVRAPVGCGAGPSAAADRAASAARHGAASVAVHSGSLDPGPRAATLAPLCGSVGASRCSAPRSSPPRRRGAPRNESCARAAPRQDRELRRDDRGVGPTAHAAVFGLDLTEDAPTEQLTPRWPL